MTALSGALFPARKPRRAALPRLAPIEDLPEPETPRLLQACEDALAGLDDEALDQLAVPSFVIAEMVLIGHLAFRLYPRLAAKCLVDVEKRDGSSAEQYARFRALVQGPHTLPTVEEEYPTCSVCMVQKKLHSFPRLDDESGLHFRSRGGVADECRKHLPCYSCCRRIERRECPLCRRFCGTMGKALVRATVRSSAPLVLGRRSESAVVCVDSSVGTVEGGVMIDLQRQGNSVCLESIAREGRYDFSNDCGNDGEFVTKFMDLWYAQDEARVHDYGIVNSFGFLVTFR